MSIFVLMADDERILSLFREGNREEAFSLLVSTYSERLYWLIRRFTCSHEDTDDLLQEVLVKAWTAFPTYRGDSRLFTWLYRIATNESLNFLRKNKVKAALRMQSLDSILEQKIEDDPYFNGNELQRELLKAVNRLPDKQKTVFNMRYYDEMKYEDMSEILGTSVGALKASYHIAYTKVKSELEKHFQ